MYALSPPINVVPLSKLRQGLSKYRRQVQAGDVVPVEYYKDRIGYLVPITIAEELQIGSELEMSLIDFRDNLNSAWESLDAGTDCIWLTYHGERRLAFVSIRVFHSSPDSDLDD
ncbi:hypothetical protein [Pantanalinema sp. GBBB05]|uniref:hypothetical protein n=1 Tax=Pantanalinema sp. GBBB05 TaxID=2604139 RepID=UPI001D583301|nr:prevent-host-death family protein [Pantanalinema sp. GBBB05]